MIYGNFMPGHGEICGWKKKGSEKHVSAYLG